MSAVKCLCPPCSCTKNTVRRHVTQFPLSVDCQPLRPTVPITRMALIVLLVEFLRWYLDVVWSGTWLSSGAWSTTEACCFGIEDGKDEVVNMDGSGDLCCRGEDSCRSITATMRSADCSSGRRRAAWPLADITARDTVRCLGPERAACNSAKINFTGTTSQSCLICDAEDACYNARVTVDGDKSLQITCSGDDVCVLLGVEVHGDTCLQITCSGARSCGGMTVRIRGNGTCYYNATDGAAIAPIGPCILANETDKCALAESVFCVASLFGWDCRATKAQEAAPHLHAVQVLEMQLLTETAPTLTSAKCLMHAELQRRQPRQLQPQPQHPQHPHHLTTEIISEEPDGLAVAIAVATAGSIKNTLAASELPSGSGGNPSLHVISLGTLCIWDPVGALAFAYQHLLGTEQGQETTTFVFRTVDIWHDLTVLGQESQETPMAQGHQICLQGRLTRLYTHQSSSSTTEASNAFWDDIMIHHHLMHPHANKDRSRMLSIAKVCKPHDCQSGST